MNASNRNALYKLARELWGEQAQIRMFSEECAEAIQAVHKILDRSAPVSVLIDELADVEIMVEQMREMFNHAELLDQAKERKLDRLRRRVDWAIEKRQVNGYPNVPVQPLGFETPADDRLSHEEAQEYTRKVNAEHPEWADDRLSEEVPDENF